MLFRQIHVRHPPAHVFLLTVFFSVFVNSFEAFNCGQTYNGSFTNGSFSSPGYPNAYSINQDCQWTIVSQPGTYIKLNITDFELEVGSCTDFVSVERVNEKTFYGCGGRETAPIVFYSYGHYTTVKFGSNNMPLSPSRGFRAEFHVLQAVCPPSHISGLSGTFASPNFPDFYPVNIQCIYNITVPQEYQVELEFLVLDLQSDPNCTADSLLVDAYDAYLYCGKFILPAPYMVSEGRTLIVKFVSDGKETYQGFKAKFKAVLKAVASTASVIQPTSALSVVPSSTVVTPAPGMQDHITSSFVPVPNRSLTGHVINKITTTSNIACVMLCQRNRLCTSVTYMSPYQSSGLCVLHNMQGTPDSLKQQSNAVYYRLVM